MSQATSPIPSRMRRARRWIVSLGLAIVLVACVLALVGLSLSRQDPDWWRTSNPTDPRTIAIGEEVEAGVVNVVYEVRPNPEAPWSVNLHAADANAWLNTRLEQWLESEREGFVWPRELEDVQVEFDEGLIRLGARVRHGESSRVYTLSLRPSVHEDGSLWVTAQSVHVGRLPVPTGWLLEGAAGPGGELLPARLRERPETERLLDALSGDAPLREQPVLGLGDGRRVRLLELASTEGRLHVRCMTEYE